MPASLCYFAYGSNMSLRRLRARVPTATPLGVGTLAGHTLRFHKRGQDGSAKCDAFVHPGQAAPLIGVMYRIPSEGKQALDRIEGLGAGYEEKLVSIADCDGNLHQACTYVATDIDDKLLPFCWYREHVLAGAREFGLPASYISAIDAVPTQPDPNPQRAAGELLLYK